MYIYKITNIINRKIYIGQTILTSEERWKEHVRNARRDKKSCPRLYEAIQKYGPDNFVIEVISVCLSGEELDKKEEKFISSYNSFNPSIGYNVLATSIPSQRGRIRSEETRIKISEAMKGKISWNKGLRGLPSPTKESLKKRSDSMRGKNTWNSSRKVSLETKAKMREAHKSSQRTKDGRFA